MTKTILASISIFVAVVAGASALAKPADGKKGQEQLVTMQVTSEGFVPAQVKVKAGQPVKLIVTRKTDVTCAKEIVIKDFRHQQAAAAQSAGRDHLHAQQEGPDSLRLRDGHDRRRHHS